MNTYYLIVAGAMLAYGGLFFWLGPYDRFVARYLQVKEKQEQI